MNDHRAPQLPPGPVQRWHWYTEKVAPHQLATVLNKLEDEGWTFEAIVSESPYLFVLVKKRRATGTVFPHSGAR